MSDIHPPLVSIIVRTKDRPKLLQKALRSIAVQTYRNIEVVLVNDGGVDLDIDDLKNLLGGMPLIYVKLDVNRGRAHAANAGIGNALGGYVGFLDDDDEYYPEHVATLVTFLEQSDYRVAYTGTEMVYQEYDPEEQRMAGREKLVFSRDFSYKDLLIVNYIPFNSILFSKNVIQSAGEFDESFPLYEDWDFLIRAASVFPFYHIRKITTMYRQWSRGMQINQADEAYMRDLRLKIIEKHREKIVPGKILEIHDEKERLFIERDRLSETLAERNSHVSRLEALLSEKERLLYEKERMILEKEQVISEKETHITRLDGSLREQVQHTADLEKQLMDRIAGLESAIGAMRDTLGWRMLETFRRWREKLLPPGKRRRRVYDLAVRTVKVFKAEGVRGVSLRSRARLSSLVHTMRELAGKALTVYRTKGFGTFLRYCAAYMLHGPGYFKARQAYTQDAYEQWIRKHEEPDMQHLRLKAKDLSYMPTISIVTPVYNVDPKWLRRCIDSVISQAYGNWELCIYDDASTNDGTLSLLKTMTGHDGRVKVVLGRENLGIAGATNEALAMATGEFIGLLDHDDELSPDALYEVAALLNAQPDLDLIYSDEDRIVETAGGEQRRYDPFFKPDWDPHLLFASMYTGHLSVYRKSIVEAVGGFRRAYDFSQDYDLALRVTERTNRIGHIRKVLYHWRAIPGSAAAGGKDFARTSNIGALTSAVQRRGYDAEVLEYPFANRVKFRIKNPPLVSVIIPTDNRANVLSCIDLLLRHTGYPNYEVIVVTNSPLGGEIKQIYSHDHRIRICPFDQPFNFSLKCNRGAEFASGDYILFLNDDVEATHESWIEDMVGVFGKGNVGGVSPKLYYENDTIQFAGMVTGVRRLVGTAFHCQPKDSGMYFNLIQSERNVSLLSGACLLMAKTLFTDVGGFDAVNTPVMHSDIDLCFKLLDRGYELIYTPFASLRHIGHLSLRETDKQDHRKKRDTVDLHVLKKWGDYLSADPYYTEHMRDMLYEDAAQYYRLFAGRQEGRFLKAKNILVVSHDLSLTGAPLLLFSLARAMRAQGCFVTLLSPVDGGLRGQYESENIPVMIDASVAAAPLEGTRKFMANFDLIVVNTLVMWPSVFVAGESGIPVLWFIHESHFGVRMLRDDENMKRAFSAADDIIFIGETTARLYEPFRSRDNFRVVGFAGPSLHRESPGHDDGKNAKKFMILHVGSIESRKGQDILIKALSGMPKHYADGIEAYMIGRRMDNVDGRAFYEKISALAERHGNIHLVGEVSRREMEDYMNRADLFVCTSRDEVGPLTVLEAMSAGRAIISTAVGGVPEMIRDGEDGNVIPVDNVEALSNGIVRLFDHREEIARLGGNARRRYLERFTMDRLAADVLAIVRQRIGIPSGNEPDEKAAQEPEWKSN